MCKLRDISERIVQKNSDNNQNVLTISAQLGLISQLEFFNKSVSAKDVSGYYLLGQNDFAYNKSYSNGYPMGAIKRLKRYEKGIVSTLYICFRFKEIVNLDFIEQYFESGIQNSEIENIAQEGARNHGLLNIGVNDFFDIEINFPSSQEQTKIANFLSSIDTKINIETKLLQKLEEQKKFLLQNLFV
ncbi:restriction endonuclease subunit S [Flectobacillus roseus]|nr:restriction endonuclease subunit S [Flectobacillus roseus]MDI9868576.1 restriction endonuclease subunit S [Flectobacillus roseus]